MADIFAKFKQFANKVFSDGKPPTQLVTKLELPELEEIHRVPDHLDELVGALRYMLARTDPNGRQCSCPGNTEVDVIIRKQFEQILHMVIDARVQTALRSRDDNTKSAGPNKSDSRRGSRPT